MKIFLHKRGSNQYKKIKKTPTLGPALAFVSGAFLLAGMVIPLGPDSNTKLLQQFEFGQYPALVVAAEVSVSGIETKQLTVDEMVDKYSKKYGVDRYGQNRLKALTHYLLLREQNYGGSTKCGDDGMACGPMQFWEGTYNRNRKDMIRKGFVTDMGSRHDLEDSIETAIYMFSIGQEKQWGPVLRGEIKI